ncbi:hypothetical protein A2331_02095 [Candidatus Falkowbacteria bacterium RIFOXYB2_FULL_34_18]|uniref:Uncharacterized protein n=1 Tax=Candidatus Falkowbacteria bacterium RIFOXYD2_FULL_34_120 TaxID=1798007 RepID=A0A1F5TR19_9BACT|nr:MAG: hypothetical protein A2331_02095 [Candidatus Falkowbacteria bacterium RIFOXYB2_FULL_34_18]OGF29540.1 MAG: hypothetical protein A2500_02435 [Candidatus Falkowbacteria bacterium RIFOXYC12_FULL_34_55]OGF36850.1 MAG: hypothetical protein A2466_06535 [Candidatus Falkowbacteria bacterium RIFOXYC2_FULL_34_220]OGF39049.1 MAG: hypothetical protein A2515_04540 [Candidatus Falkowbacteria bacterium RIFOXYD12_FULL_34_57]OGF41298.1 MAG: hypothetical protein A2531_00350 [Candidatus Falkowbacteria bact
MKDKIIKSLQIILNSEKIDTESREFIEDIISGRGKDLDFEKMTISCYVEARKDNLKPLGFVWKNKKGYNVCVSPEQLIQLLDDFDFISFKVNLISFL